MSQQEKEEQAPASSRRGFASMDAERQRAISSRGGKAAHEKGKAHQFTSEEARAAGRKGGVAVSRDREHMARIGRQGGRARGAESRPIVSSNPPESTSSTGALRSHRGVVNTAQHRGASSRRGTGRRASLLVVAQRSVFLLRS